MIHQYESVNTVYTCLGAKNSFKFGDGVLPTQLRVSSCSGDEDSLLACNHYTSTCSYGRDTGIICEGRSIY